MRLLHAWVMAVEILGEQDKISCKSGDGEEQSLCFFKLQVLCFPLRKTCNVMDEYAQYSKNELVWELKNINREQ